MKAKQLMATDVGACAPENDLAIAAAVMWTHDCGFVPVVDSQGAVSGVITDRDICRAVASKHRTLEHIAAREAMSHPVFACSPDDDVTTALATMATHRVRRLPVLDEAGHLRGVLSIDDVVMAPTGGDAPATDEIVATLRAICRHRPVEAVPS